MEREKISIDFEKRFFKSAEKIFFCGFPLVFFKTRELTIAAAMSAGGYIASAQRADDRINLQYERSNRVFRIKMEENGIFGEDTHGRDMVIYKDLPISTEQILRCESILTGKRAKREGINAFEDAEMAACVLSRKNRVVAISEKWEYLPFRSQSVKTILCVSEEKKRSAPASAYADDAVRALLSDDIEKFAKTVSKSYRQEKNLPKKSRSLFDIAERQGFSLGNGILTGGGIFALAENDRVDAFMQNLARDSKKYLGGCPDFYVTESADSGIFL